MEKILQMVMVISWALWLVYSYVVLFTRKEKPGRGLLLVTFMALGILTYLLKTRLMMVFTAVAMVFLLVGMSWNRTSSKKTTPQPPLPSPGEPPPSFFHTFLGMLLTTITLVSLLLLLGRDFKSDAHYFVEAYHFTIDPAKKEIIIGNSKTDSDITLENDSAESAHLRLVLNEKNFSLRNISETKKVDLNGRYLNRMMLKPGDEFEVNGREKIKILTVGPQYPLGRSFQAVVRVPGQNRETAVTLHTLLNKSLVIQYRSPTSSYPSAGFGKLLVPGTQDRPVASITYEPHRYFLGMNIYYLIIVLTILSISLGIFLYLKNQFNGALLLWFIASLPFMAGAAPVVFQVALSVVFLLFLVYVQQKRKTAWNWGTVLLVLLMAVIFSLPYLLKMDGDFYLQHYDFTGKDVLAVTRGQETFQLKDLQATLAYEKKHRVILGHTQYQLVVSKKAGRLELTPLNPEKIKITPGYKAVICDLNQVTPGDDFVYVKYPHRFDPIPAPANSSDKHLTIADTRGNTLVLSKRIDEHYNAYLRGLIFYIFIPFWLFLLLNYFGIQRLIKTSSRVQTPRSPQSLPARERQQELFNKNNLVIYQWIYFLLGLGYVVFGALALHNNDFFKNFENYRTQALPLFVGLFLLSLLLVRYNRFLVFLYRVLRQRKFHVPLILGTILILLVYHHKAFFYMGIGYLVFILVIRLRKNLIYEYRNARSIPLNIKYFIEKTIASFEDKSNRRMFFGLGRVLDKKGWNYLLVSDLFLLWALFFIVLQVFLGGELGVAAAGFTFFPIELGKILLTIYFADWVSRIDRGMELNVLWIYGLVLIPFVLLIVFVKDFSPLLVFSFVFLYHIIKIKKNWFFKLLLIASILFTMVITVIGLNQYALPYRYFGIILSVLLSIILLGVWFKRNLPKPAKIFLTLVFAAVIVFMNYATIFHTLPTPKTLAGRVSSWLNPWQDYNLSYQYVNALWLMKGAGTFGKPTAALAAAGYVPLIEKDLGFSLYVGVLGTLGIVFIFFTLFMAAAYVHKLGHRYGDRRGSPYRWHLYLLEFLVVIFLAQFTVPALYAVGLLPIMGQPLPFLSYSNNLLLLFVLPFSFLMMVIGNNLAESTEDTERAG